MAPRYFLVTILAVVVGAGTALSLRAGAEAPSVVASALGDEGKLYQLRTGSFGELFPDDPTHPAENRALALDLVTPDGSRERVLVPGTGDAEIEGAPSVVFEDASQRMYAVWESKKTPIVSRLVLAYFGPDGWAEPLEISGDVSPLKDAPRVLVTRDRFALRDPSGARPSRSRTAIHVVWREEGPSGSGFFYTPVILESGRYMGWNPVVALDELESSSAQPTATGATELLQTPELAAGQDIHSVVIGMLSPESERLLTVEARLLPGEIGFLADVLRGHIIEIGNRDREDIQAAADALRGHIIEIGHRLNGGVVRHFAERAHDSLIETWEEDPDRPIEVLADVLRGHIIEIGADLFGGPVHRTQGSALVEIGPTNTGETPGPTTPTASHLVRLQVVSERPAPPLDDVPAKMFLSEDGERVLVGWVHEGKVYYTESSEEPGPESGPWTAVRHMTLTERLGIPEAAAILEARVRRQR